MKHFTFSFVFTAIALGLAAWWGFNTGGLGGALGA